MAAVMIHVGAGAASGAINAAITGGDIGQGTLTGGISAGVANAFGKFLPDEFGAQFFGRTLIGGITGGITTEIYGGDFQTGFIFGATTAAVATLANEFMPEILKWLRGGGGVFTPPAQGPRTTCAPAGCMPPDCPTGAETCGFGTRSGIGKSSPPPPPAAKSRSAKPFRRSAL